LNFRFVKTMALTQQEASKSLPTAAKQPYDSPDLDEELSM